MANSVRLRPAGIVGGVGGGLAIAASALAAVATAISSLDGDLDLVPFFVLLTFAGGLVAVLLHSPVSGTRRLLARIIAVAWVGAAVWAGALLAWYQVLCACSMPPAPPELTYLGLPATAYHLVATFVGGALVTVAAFGSPSRMERPPDDAPRQTRTMNSSKR